MLRNPLGRFCVMMALTVITPAGVVQAAAPNPCDPRTYGAIGNGVTDDTVAIQTAINNCAALGGGTVPFDFGVFLTGPFQLKDDIVLRIAAGATVLGTTDPSRYLPAYIGTRYRATEALISTDNASDVDIIGGGTIDGQGDVISATDGMSWYGRAASAPFPYASYPFAPSSNGLPRPWLVEFWMTDHIVVQGVHLARSPMWTLVQRYATDVTIAGISDSAPSTSRNTDAVDVVSSDGVRISAVNFASGDDDVALKSGLPSQYQDPKAPPMPAAATQNVTVANAVFTSGHGMSIGSEAINGVNNIAIMNVALSNTSNGFRIKTGRDRGSVIKNITAQDLTMVNVAQPIVINSYYPASNPPTCGADPGQPVTPTTPFVSNVTLRNVAATGATSQSFIDGLPESSVLNVTLDNVTVGQATSSVKPMDLRYMVGTFSNVTVSPTSTGHNFICLVGVTVTGESLP
ncbi:MAG TPA: glycosyl hydrolase family 28 protein [Casimicrobiaceae bacterium]|nr:glycosyl hydrolase family 28 protein [Casimicrobiaceae bacterium]